MKLAAVVFVDALLESTLYAALVTRQWAVLALLMFANVAWTRGLRMRFIDPTDRSDPKDVATQFESCIATAIAIGEFGQVLLIATVAVRVLLSVIYCAIFPAMPTALAFVWHATFAFAVLCVVCGIM